MNETSIDLRRIPARAAPERDGATSPPQRWAEISGSGPFGAFAQANEDGDDFSRRLRAELAKLPAESRRRADWRPLHRRTQPASRPDSGHPEPPAVDPRPADRSLQNACDSLAVLVRAWPRLPENCRAQILAMIRASGRAD